MRKALKTLILGASGSLGRSFALHTVNQTLPLSVSLQTMESVEDVLDKIEDTVKRKSISTIINLIAKTDVAWCAQNPNDTFVVNTIFPVSLGRLCTKLGIRLIQVSTDAVRRSVSDRTDTVFSTYAMSKALADNQLLCMNDLALNIVRCSYVSMLPSRSIFSAGTKLNFGEQVRKLCIEENSTFTFYSDQEFSPVSGRYLVNFLDLCAFGKIPKNLTYLKQIQNITRYEFALALSDRGVIKKEQIIKANPYPRIRLDQTLCADYIQDSSDFYVDLIKDISINCSR